MKKIELEAKVKEYEDILIEIGRWANPLQYKLTESTPKDKILFNLNGIRRVLDRKFYKEAAE